MQNTVIVLYKVHARNRPMVRYIAGLPDLPQFSSISPHFFQIYSKFHQFHQGLPPKNV